MDAPGDGALRFGIVCGDNVDEIGVDQKRRMLEHRKGDGGLIERQRGAGSYVLTDEGRAVLAALLLAAEAEPRAIEIEFPSEVELLTGDERNVREVGRVVCVGGREPLAPCEVSSSTAPLASPNKNSP